MISFTIKGRPKALKRHRYSAKLGRNYDPSSKDKSDLWLQIAKFRPKLPIAGDVRISIRFTMGRPKHHYRTGKYAHLLKDKCKDIIYHSIVPDLDNLVKLLLDSVCGKGKMICDDSQVCEMYAEKRYGEKPNTAVIIEEI